MSMPSAALLITGVVLVIFGLMLNFNMIVAGLGVVAMIAAGLLELPAVRRR